MDDMHLDKRGNQILAAIVAEFIDGRNLLGGGEHSVTRAMLRDATCLREFDDPPRFVGISLDAFDYVRLAHVV